MLNETLNFFCIFPIPLLILKFVPFFQQLLEIFVQLIFELFHQIPSFSAEHLSSIRLFYLILLFFFLISLRTIVIQFGLFDNVLNILEVSHSLVLIFSELKLILNFFHSILALWCLVLVAVFLHNPSIWTILLLFFEFECLFHYLFSQIL